MGAQQELTTEQVLANALIARATAAAQPFQGEFRAPWLISESIYCETWVLRRGGGESRIVNGKWVGVERFSWALRLPDGSILTDKENSFVLRSMQQIGFLARAAEGGPNSVGPFILFLNWLCVFARWAFLQNIDLDLRRNAFSKITHSNLCDFVRDLAKGGVAIALKCPQRLLIKLFPIVLQRAPTSKELDDPMSLSEEDCKRVRDWLIATKQLKKTPRQSNKEKIKLKAIADMLSVDYLTLGRSPQFRGFLSQFENGPLASQTMIARGIGECRREYPTQRHKLSIDLANDPATEKSLQAYLDGLKTLVALKRHLPQVCPDPNEFHPVQLRAIGLGICRESSSTPWVPLSIALDYTTEAIRWVHVYGELVVDVFLDVFSKLSLKNLLSPVLETGAARTKVFKAQANARDELVASIALPDPLKDLNISGWASYMNYQGTQGFIKLRSSPSMLDAVMILVAAISILIATVKPMRESELRKLRRGCVRFVKGDGFWLNADQRKRIISDEVLLRERPIPKIAAKAILLMQRLTDGVKAILNVKDEYILDCIYAMPPISRYEASASPSTKYRLNQILDIFVDYVALPVDSLGRRWYIRIHELRKSFLITFFWTYRYANLEAAAWMAGHANIEELYAYLQANFPGEELPALEAEFASKVLRSNESQTGVSADQIERLHHAVCDHFHVNDVSWIEERSLHEWLKLRFSSGDFSIEPFTLRKGNGSECTQIAIKLKGVA
ncbi:MAG: hypothetical protein EON58_01790 [Alphaproteobacteria bacterium]|nr:MAG: hypothetical protein EON58_01790 [Alphaproteobacteria bacterium]